MDLSPSHLGPRLELKDDFFFVRKTFSSASDIQQALLPPHKNIPESVLDRPLVNFQLNDVLSEVARHYLSRALEASNGNKVEAAKLVGLPSYQTFTNWLSRYGISNSKEGNG
jgi:DNA-binding NtrC family response regulator